MQFLDLTKLKRSFFSVSALYVFGIAITLVANIILTRILTVAEFGAFGLAISIATVLSIPITSGMPMLLTREVATYVASKNWNSYRGILISAYCWIAAFSVLVFLGALIWILFTDQQYDTSFLIPFLIAPLLGLNSIRNGMLKGLSHPIMAEAPVQLVQPVILVVGYLWLAHTGQNTTVGVLIWYTATTVIVFVIATTSFIYVQPVSISTLVSSYDDRPRWLRSIVPFAMLGAVTALSTQAAILLLGYFDQNEAVAQLRVAERGAQLVAFPLAFINSVLGPYLVNASKGKNVAELKRVTIYSARLTFAVSLPIGLVLIVFGEKLISLTFGPPYDQQAYIPMVILVLAQLSSVALGNSGMLLAMTGHEKFTVYSLGFSILINIIVALCLIERYGATGGAIGAAAGIVSAKIFAFFWVKRYLGISPGLL